jgi:hypothetical protein
MLEEVEVKTFTKEGLKPTKGTVQIRTTWLRSHVRGKTKEAGTGKVQQMLIGKGGKANEGRRAL